MSSDVDYTNNPLHGVGLKTVVTELVEHYGYKILFAYLNINCFKTNPSIDSSVKFLKKSTWAREKVEAFYLYKYKNLPRASAEQFELPPRERIVPEHQKPREPAELSLEDAERLRELRAKKAAERSAGRPQGRARRSRHEQGRTERRRSGPSSADDGPVDPWANSKG